MPTSPGSNEVSYSPDGAFADLGNETRMEILQVLGQAEKLLSFSELRERLEINDPGQVNYHLNRLRGHFVRQTEEGYNLHEPGHRIIQAVLSGSVTGESVLDPTRVDEPCPYCSEPVQISYREERLLIRCTHCAGTFAGSDSDAPFLEARPYGTVAVLPLPPAGVAGRSPGGVLDATMVWTLTDFLALASGVCPRCSVAIDWSLQACEAHEPNGGRCEVCNTRHAVHVDYDCPNCTHKEAIVPVGFILFLSAPELMAFFSARGIIPAIPSWDLTKPMFDFEDEVIATDPLEMELTYTVEGDQLVLTVDEGLDVVDSAVITGMSG